jgi:CopG family nickel-responsive transcriptional regulator
MVVIMSAMEKSKGVKFGIYLQKELIKEIDEIMMSSSIRNRSKLIQEALRLFIVENRWVTSAEVVGSISILYDHSITNIDEMLTDIQHIFRDVVISSMHVHLDENRCMLVIAVKGSSQRVKEFLDKVRMLKGTLIVRHTLLSV